MQLKKAYTSFILFWILMIDAFKADHQLDQRNKNYRRSIQTRDAYRTLIIDYIQENFVLDNGILNQPVDSRTSQVLNYLINEEGHSELLLSSDRISTKRLKQVYRSLKRDNYLLKMGQLMICKKINDMINENFRSTPRSDLYFQLKEYSVNLTDNKYATKQFFELVITCMNKYKKI